MTAVADARWGPATVLRSRFSTPSVVPNWWASAAEMPVGTRAGAGLVLPWPDPGTPKNAGAQTGWYRPLPWTVDVQPTSARTRVTPAFPPTVVDFREENQPRPGGKGELDA